MKNKIIKKDKGFTLVEVLVATFIFTSIVVMAIGSLITTLDSAKNARALRTAMDNVNYAMESMSRSIRMGSNYFCSDSVGDIDMTANNTITEDCSDGDSFIAVKPQSGARIGFGVADRPGTTTHTLLKYVGNETPTEIVSSDVDIEQLKFFVTGSTPLSSGDYVQAKVRIIMKGTVMVKNSPVSFALQTLVSQRNY